MTDKQKKVNIRKFEGVVVSDKAEKTRVVAVTRLTKHPRYEKYYKVTKRFPAHDEKNEYKIGDIVIIEETRPLSKTKRWKIARKVEK
jgi:small subunit ribosomal protein S17